MNENCMKHTLHRMVQNLSSRFSNRYNITCNDGRLTDEKCMGQSPRMVRNPQSYLRGKTAIPQARASQQEDIGLEHGATFKSRYAT